MKFRLNNEIWEVNYRSYGGWSYKGKVRIIKREKDDDAILCEVLDKKSNPNHRAKNHPRGPWKLFINNQSLIKKL